jgi:DNA invertase Pin-like site-specific DNA recombinase
MNKAYSYIRFSSKKQSEGTSLQRQMSSIDRWLEQNPEYTLSESNYQDLGVSGYTGAHKETGAFGAFLQACENGSIKKGSVLLVESIDRLGRLSTPKMLTIFLDLFSYISIVTLIDSTTYKEESLENHQVHLLLAKIQCAHDYSQVLSTRLLKARATTREEVIMGKKNKLTKTCPSWLVWSDNEQTFLEIPERVAIVRTIFDMYTDLGLGTTAIASKLNRQNVPSFNDKGWYGSYIAKVLFSRKVLGYLELQQRSAAGNYVEGYYPQVIDANTFRKAQALKQVNSKQFKTKTETNRPPLDIFAGTVFCSCGTEAKLYNKGRGYFAYFCKNRSRGLCKESTSIKVQDFLAHFSQYLEFVFIQYSNTKQRSITADGQHAYKSKEQMIDDLESAIEDAYDRITFYREQLFMARDDVEKLGLNTLMSEYREVVHAKKLEQEELKQKKHLDDLLDIVEVQDLKKHRLTWQNYLSGKNQVASEQYKLAILKSFLQGQDFVVELTSDGAILKLKNEAVLTVRKTNKNGTISYLANGRIYLSLNVSTTQSSQFGTLYLDHIRSVNTHNDQSHDLGLSKQIYPVTTQIFKT